MFFFHGIAYGIDDNWKQTWTTRPMDDKEECIWWPQMWIPKDLNDNVKILSLSYDSNAVTSVHNDVTEIGRNLIQSLVIDWRCDNFFIYGHLIFHCVFQLKIIDCILTSLNKLFMWSIIVVPPKQKLHHHMGEEGGRPGGPCCYVSFVCTGNCTIPITNFCSTPHFFFLELTK